LVQCGKPIVEPTAADCRRALGVKFGAQRGNGVRLTPDQQLAHIIPLAVRGWPKRSNPHERDAAAAALWALGGAEVETAVRLALAGARA
jgi:predicted RNase H-like nuclease (RuvC/YqgF family)